MTNIVSNYLAKQKMQRIVGIKTQDGRHIWLREASLAGEYLQFDILRWAIIGLFFGYFQANFAQKYRRLT